MKTYKKIFILLLCLFVASINFNLILKSLHLVAGGTQGISILINYLYNIKPSIIIIIINITALILSFIFLGIDSTKGIIIATFMYPFFVRITSFISISISVFPTILLVIISGIISGITNSYILKMGYSTGGINVFVLILKKYLLIKESTSIFIMNTIIIIFGAFYFGIEKAIYSVLLIFISSLVINKIVK